LYMLWDLHIRRDTALAAGLTDGLRRGLYCCAASRLFVSR